MREALVRDGAGFTRVGADAWRPESADLLRRFYDLSPTVVIGDLGPEPEDDRYRLVITTDFDAHPRSIPSVSPDEEVTEAVIDGAGRTIRLSVHYGSAQLRSGGIVEGVWVYTFSHLEEPIPLPSLPGGASTAPKPTRPSTNLAKTGVPGGGFTVLLPMPQTDEVRELTFYGPGSKATTLQAAFLHADISTGARYEVGSSRLPASIGTGLSASDVLKGARTAIPSRTSNGTTIGYRRVTVAGYPAEEVVATAADATQRAILLRIRTVVDGDRLITMMVAGSAADLGSADTDRFLESLARGEP